MAKKTEQETYAEIVASVKAKAAKKAPGQVSGDQVSYEIAKRWAKHKGEPFKLPKPDGPGELGSTAVSPPATHKVGPIKRTPGVGVKPKMPEEEKAPDEE